jgi:2-polyprenyl-6-methoxyphenol hydroxylase-like FAD-dependent oxidoreductase
VTRVRDVIVVGGGPVGLAFAAAAAGRGLDVLVLEPRPFPIDKGCGEGILPAGVRALEALGVRDRLGPGDASPLAALRWIDSGGEAVELMLPAPGGLGVRRTALSEALLVRARQAGVELVEAAALDHRRGGDAVTVETAAGQFRARLLVAADGLASPIRSREGLDRPVRGPRRFGLRRHLAFGGLGAAVEVHLGDGAEAYLTPAGTGRTGVAFLFEGAAPGGWEALLARFPRLAERLSGAVAVSEDRGAGPLVRRARARVLDRLVLLGDAAGTLDALGGEGLTLGLGCALDLAALAPEAITRRASRQALLPYELAWRRRWRPANLATKALLALARRPALRRVVMGLAARAPSPFERLVALAVG